MPVHTSQRPLAAKLFKNGGSQAVRIPKSFSFKTTEVLIHKEGRRVVIEPKPITLGELAARMKPVDWHFDRNQSKTNAENIF